MLQTFETRTAALLDWAAFSFLHQALIVGVVALAILVPGLSSLPVTDRDEARFAQASKQMVETGDLIDIHFQDQPRWKKPAGIYWLQAASASVFGGADAPIWAYRIPSALAAFLAALLTLWAARPLMPARAALLAGLMMCGTLLMAAEGHIAKTDAALAATSVAALGALAHLFVGRGGLGAALVFWLSIAFSLLIKGPIVPAIAAFALAALWLRRDLRPRFSRLRALPGLALTALIVLPWLLAIWRVSDGEFFAESVGKDMAAKLASGQENHWGPPGLYLALVWLTSWPWAALLPQAVPWLARQRREAWVLLLAGWVLPFWLVLEVVPTKLPHYVLPLYPALIIGAAAFAASGAETPRWSRRLAAGLIAVPGLLIAAGIAALPVIADLARAQVATTDRPNLLPTEFSWPATVLAILAALLVVAAARAALTGRRLAQVSASLGACLALYPAILAFALPAARTGFPSPELARLIQQYRPCASGPAWTMGYHEPSLVFLTETGLRSADPEGTVRALTDDPGALVLIEDRWIAILKSLPPHVIRATVSYFNPNRGKLATARLITPDDPRWAACE